MANDTGSSKHVCASIYFRLSSLLGLHLMENSLNVKYLENGDRYHDGSKQAEYDTALGLSIGTITFDLG